MAQFTYLDTQSRTYPDISVSGAVLVAESGKVYDLDADPGDGRWASVGSVKVALPDVSTVVNDATPTESE